MITITETINLVALRAYVDRLLREATQMLINAEDSNVSPRIIQDLRQKQGALTTCMNVLTKADA